MSQLEDKLRLHFANMRAIWSTTWEHAAVGATWNDADGRRLLLGVDGPVTAGRIVEAYVQGLDDGAKVTLAYEGTLSPVAREAAERLGVELLDAGTIRVAAPVSVPAPVPPPVSAPAPVPVPDPIDAPLLAHVDELVHALEDEPVLPWSGPAAPEPEVTLHVEPQELLALPWNHPAHADPDDHVEIMAGNPRAPTSVPRPTVVTDWGLPWPRPPTPDGGLSIADPKLWSARERTKAMHDDLDARGGGSFGTIKALPVDASAWLRRLQQGL